ncbi:MAG TPA: sugar kinase, partial [Acidobacteriota bacterium]|nr:sugar kinase [Acidobacteriota bacterium]
MPEIVSIGEVLVEIMRPKVGVPLDQPDEFKGPFPSGAPANYINAVAKLGGDAGFIGVLGPDEFGDLVEQRLSENGVDVSQLIRRPEYTTGCAFVAYQEDGSRRFLFHMRHAAAGTLSPEDVSPEFLSDTKLLHITGSALAASDSCREACHKAIGIVKDSGGQISFDPNIRPELLGIEKTREICTPVVQASDLILPSGEEACMLTGLDSLEAACQKLLESCSVLALKLGADGSRIYSRSMQLDVPPLPIEKLMPTVDPTGAGDAFGAGFCVAFIKGQSLAECAELGNAAGALCITGLGPMEAPLTLEGFVRLRE